MFLIKMQCLYLLLLPDEIVLTDEMIAKIRTFLRNGGKLLASGGAVVRDGNFVFDFGVEYEGENEYCPDYVRPCFDNEFETDYIM